jgi:hypothetical protein
MPMVWSFVDAGLVGDDVEQRRVEVAGFDFGLADQIEMAVVGTEEYDEELADNVDGPVLALIDIHYRTQRNLADYKLAFEVAVAAVAAAVAAVAAVVAAAGAIVNRGMAQDIHPVLVRSQTSLVGLTNSRGVSLETAAVPQEQPQLLVPRPEIQFGVQR